jgi:hypothetical protein
MIMLILLVPAALLGLLLGMDRLERWAVQDVDDQTYGGSSYRDGSRTTDTKNSSI